MAPKGCKKLTATEKIARLQQQALQLQTKHSLDWIAQNLKNRLDLVPSVVQHMKQLGINDIGLTEKALLLLDHSPDPKAALAAASPDHSTAASLGKATTATPSGSSGVAPSCASDGTEPEDDPAKVLPEIPRKYRQWSVVPPAYMVELLSTLEPVSLGKQALKVYAPKGKKTLKRQALEQLWEFVTGIVPTANITPKQRNMEKFKKDLIKVNLQRGRLARDMVLPVHWGDDGHYTIEKDIEKPGLARVKNKHEEKSETFCISLSDFELENSEQLKDLYVESNWSEASAVICHPLSSHRVVVAMEMARTKTAAIGMKRPIADIEEDDLQDDEMGKLARKLFKDSKVEGEEKQEEVEEKLVDSAGTASRRGEAVDEELMAPARPEEEAA